MKRIFSGRLGAILLLTGLLAAGACAWLLRPNDLCPVHEHQHTDVCYALEEQVLSSVEKESPDGQKTLSCKRSEHMHGELCIAGEKMTQNRFVPKRWGSLWEIPLKTTPSHIRAGVMQMLSGILMLYFQKKRERKQALLPSDCADSCCMNMCIEGSEISFEEMNKL